jgi:enterochelin esterase-like enzyme
MLTITSLILGMLVASQDADLTESWQDYPPCSLLEAALPSQDLTRQKIDAGLQACALPMDDITPDSASRLLGETRFAFEAEPENGVLTLYARPHDINARLRLSGLSVELTPISDTLAAGRFRLADMNSAMLTFYLPPNLAENGRFQIVTWRGAEAPSQRMRVEALEGQVERVELYSEALGETRRLEIYTPPGFDPAAAPYPAIFMADGSQTPYFAYLIETGIQTGELEPLVIIGLMSGERGIVEEIDPTVDWRSADYIPGWYEAEPRFEQHLSFVTDEVAPWAVEHYGISEDPARRLVMGHSSGGVFALHAGYRHPDQFGWAFPFSPGRVALDTLDFETEQQARFRFGVGRYEPRFHVSAENSHALLIERGYDSEFNDFSAGHTDDIRNAVLIDWLDEAFPGR